MAGPRIDWTEQALRQLDQAYDYIALSNSEDVAAKVAMQIVTSVQQLIAFPMSGRPGRVSRTRELVISNTPFIAASTIERHRIVILAIYHGAQAWPKHSELGDLNAKFLRGRGRPRHTSATD